DISYVGRFAHRLLAQEDLAMPLDLVDPRSGIHYFAAARRLSELAEAGIDPSAITPALVGPTAAYWQNIITPLQPGDAYSDPFCGDPTTSALQAAYILYSCSFNHFNETTAQGMLDFYGVDFAGNAGFASTTHVDADGFPTLYY